MFWIAIGALFVVILFCAGLTSVTQDIRAFCEKRRLKRAAKAALRQKGPPVSRHAVLNPALLNKEAA